MATPVRGPTALPLEVALGQVDRRGIPPPADQDPTLHDFGGAVLTRPVVSTLYVGDYFDSEAGQADVRHNDAFAKEFGSSAMADVIRQYRWAGLPSFDHSAVVPGASPQRLTKTEVENLVRQQLAAGTVKQSPQGIINVVLPPKTVLVDDNGTTSLDGMGGFHGSLQGLDGDWVYYSVIAYGDKDNGANLDDNPQDNISIVESHEWCEVATDPDIGSSAPGAALGFINLRWGEVGDLGVYLLPRDQVWTFDDAGFAVQREWSNNDRLFEIAVR